MKNIRYVSPLVIWKVSQCAELLKEHFLLSIIEEARIRQKTTKQTPTKKSASVAI